MNVVSFNELPEVRKLMKRDVELQAANNTLEAERSAIATRTAVGSRDLVRAVKLALIGQDPVGALHTDDAGQRLPELRFAMRANSEARAKIADTLRGLRAKYIADMRAEHGEAYGRLAKSAAKALVTAQGELAKVEALRSALEAAGADFETPDALALIRTPDGESRIDRYVADLSRIASAS